MIGDAFGEMLDRIDKGMTGLHEIVERDDGFFAIGGGVGYLAPFRKWIPVERRAFRYVRGRVLDLGSGGGRVLIEAQNRGLAAVGIESAPIVVRVARRRGARNVKVMRVEDLDRLRGTFDTVVMYGNNFGMLGSPTKTRRLLRKLAAKTSADARILAGNMDPYRTKLEWHRAYQERNRRRGRPGGAVRLRLRHGPIVTRWFDWLFMSHDEVEEIVDGTGWRVARFVDDGGPMYVAILEKDEAL